MVQPPTTFSVYSGMKTWRVHRRILSGASGSLAALSLLAAQGAFAQPACTTVGPDVVIGDLTAPGNFNTVGEIDVFSLGTAFCNMTTFALFMITRAREFPRTDDDFQ